MLTNRLLISDTCSEHFFYRQNCGILARCRGKNGLWSEPFCATDDAKGPFCVLSDLSGQKHLIYIDNENRLVYAIRKNETWKRYILAKLSPEIKPKRMELFPVSGRLNLMYSAEYNGDCVLVHCILGNHAKPQIIDTLKSCHFSIYNKKAYYTNASGAIGYTDLSDEKPDTFCKICDSGDNISVYDYNGIEFILYSKDSRLFVNSKELVYDSRMEMPTMTCSKDKLYIMWKSGGYIRYVTSQNCGECWENPMRFMTNGAQIETFYLQKSGNMYMFYGYNTPCDLHIFSKPDILKQ